MRVDGRGVEVVDRLQPRDVAALCFAERLPAFGRAHAIEHHRGLRGVEVRHRGLRDLGHRVDELVGGARAIVEERVRHERRIGLRRRNRARRVGGAAHHHADRLRAHQRAIHALRTVETSGLHA